MFVRERKKKEKRQERNKIRKRISWEARKEKLLNRKQNKHGKKIQKKKKMKIISARIAVFQINFLIK